MKARGLPGCEVENSLNVRAGQLFTCKEVAVRVCLHACYLTGA